MIIQRGADVSTLLALQGIEAMRLTQAQGLAAVLLLQAGATVIQFKEK